MEYLNIVVVFLGIIITLLLALWGTYPLSKKNKVVIRIRIIFTIVLLVLLLGAISFFYIFNRKEKLDNEFSQQYSEFLSLMNSGSYPDAISTIDKLLYTYKDDADRVYELTYNKALCYFKYAIEIDDKSYIDEIIQLLSSIKDIENKSSEDIQNNVRVLLGYSYLILDEPIYKNMLDDLVLEIETQISSSDNLDCVYYFLGSYYYNNFENTGEQLFLDQAMHYYEKGIDIGINAKNKNTSENLLYNLMYEHVGYCYLKYGAGIVLTNVDESITYIKQAAEIYEALLAAQDPKKDIYQYFYYKKELSRCYCFVGMLGLDNELLDTALEYMEDIIEMNEEIIDDHLVGLVPLYITLKNYDEVNVELIIERYNRLLEKNTVSTNLNKAFDIRTNLVTIYYTLAVKSGIQGYYEDGKEILNELKENYYPLVSTSQKEYILDLENLYND